MDYFLQNYVLIYSNEDISHPASRGRRDASSGRAWARGEWLSKINYNLLIL
jgi:hypothetical protein